jgi:hypothetical protein
MQEYMRFITEIPLPIIDAAYLLSDLIVLKIIYNKTFNVNWLIGLKEWIVTMIRFIEESYKINNTM